MNSKQERLTAAYLEYQKIKDAALVSYTEILDLAHKAYRKIVASIEAESNDITNETIPNTGYLQIGKNIITYKYNAPLCSICMDIIQGDDEVIPLPDSNGNVSIDSMVHKSCKILSSDADKQS